MTERKDENELTVDVTIQPVIPAPAGIYWRDRPRRSFDEDERAAAAAEDKYIERLDRIHERRS
jgi:hypothetical protein